MEPKEYGHLNIALDYDNTVTADALLWMHFAIAAFQRGHEVRIVTFRMQNDITDDMKMFAEASGIAVIIATNQTQKRAYCKSIGWVPDIWIDDSPEFIVSHDELENPWTEEQYKEWQKSLESS